MVRYLIWYKYISFSVFLNTVYKTSNYEFVVKYRITTK